VENINHLADVRRGGASHDAGMTDQRIAIDTNAAAPVSRPTEPPPSARYRRAGPAAGLAGLVLFAGGSLLAGLPGPNTRVATVITHLTADRGAVLAGILLMFLALPGLLMFLGYLRNLLAGAEGPPAVLAATAAAAWLLLFAVIGIGLVPLVAVAWRGTAGLPPAVVRLCADMATLSLYALSAPAAAVSVLAPSAVIWRTRVLPRVAGPVRAGRGGRQRRRTGRADGGQGQRRGRVRRRDRAAAVDALGRGPVRVRARRRPPGPPGLAEAA